MKEECTSIVCQQFQSRAICASFLERSAAITLLAHLQRVLAESVHGEGRPSLSQDKKKSRPPYDAAPDTRGKPDSGG